VGVEDAEAQIREEAYRLWEAEGWPEGRAHLHWVAAKEIVAVRATYASTLRRFEGTRGERAEPVIPFQNQVTTPTLTNRGEGQAGATKIAVNGDSVEMLPSGSDPRLEGPDRRSALRRGIDAAVDRINRKRSR
jgi:hypothetical protein